MLSRQIGFQDDGLDCTIQMKTVIPLARQLPEALIVCVGFFNTYPKMGTF